MEAYSRAQRWMIDDDAGLASPGVERLTATPAESQQQLSLELNTVVVGGDGDTHLYPTSPRTDSAKSPSSFTVLVKMCCLLACSIRSSSTARFGSMP